MWDLRAFTFPDFFINSKSPFDFYFSNFSIWWMSSTIVKFHFFLLFLYIYNPFYFHGGHKTTLLHHQFYGNKKTIHKLQLWIVFLILQTGAKSTPELFPLKTTCVCVCVCSTMRVSAILDIMLSSFLFKFFIKILFIFSSPFHILIINISNN